MRQPSPGGADATAHRRSFLHGLLGVLLLLAAFPPVDAWPLGLLAPWPLLLGATGARSGARAFWRFCLYGLLIIDLGSYWLAETSLFNLAIVTLVEAPIFGVFGWLAWRTLRDGGLFPAVPLLFTAHEMVRMSWPETGYGWILLGQALAASPLLVQVADLGGVLAVTFVGASAATALWALVSGRPGRVPAACVVAGALLYGIVRPATLGAPQEGPLLVSIQPGFPQQLKEAPAAEGLRWERCLALTQDLGRAHPEADLLVFPETMWPWWQECLLDGRSDAAARQGPASARLDAALAAAASRLAAHRAELSAAFAGQRTSQLLGVPSSLAVDSGEILLLNSALLFPPQGPALARYDKHILIPGGEYVPFRGTLPAALRAWLDRMVRELADFVPDLAPGPGARVLRLPAADGADALPFGVTICFENAYGAYTSEFVAQGARFLVNLSNEGWFGTSPEFDHMELQSVLRAVETRRALFRSTNTGISCLVRPDGRRPAGADRLVVDGQDRGVAGGFAARVPLHDDRTLYVACGDWPGWLALAGCAWLLLRRRPSRVS